MTTQTKGSRFSSEELADCIFRGPERAALPSGNKMFGLDKGRGIETTSEHSALCKVVERKSGRTRYYVTLNKAGDIWSGWAGDEGKPLQWVETGETIFRLVLGYCQNPKNAALLNQARQERRLKFAQNMRVQDE